MSSRLLIYFSVLYGDDPVRFFSHVHVVGDKDKGLVIFFYGGFKEGEYLVSRSGVQISRRLVGEDYSRFGNHCTGNSNSLLLTARQLVRVMGKPVCDAHSLCYLVKICFIGFLTVFQTWTQMSGIYEIFGDTPIGTTGGTLIVYGTCLVFLFMLLKEGMIRNVLSDGFSWVVVYGLLAVVVIAALVYTHGAFVNIDPGLTAAGIQTGLYKGFLLLPGPFTYPYYYSLFSYNDKNEDGTQHGNMKKSFVLAGVMFGVYMVLAALLTWVNFSPLLNTLKAILITIIALSSLSTYLYSEYLVFGENIGFLIDVLTVTSWQLVIPLGVMGIWTLMSELRVYIIIVLLASVVLHLVSDRKEDAR